MQYPVFVVELVLSITVFFIYLWLFFIFRIIPAEALTALHRFFGYDKQMLTYTGREKVA